MVFSVANYADGLPNPASSVSRAAVEYGSTASPTVARGEIVPDRMACLRQSYQMQGLSERVAELLIQSWRNNTIQPGVSGIAGVLYETIIPFQYL